MFLPVFLIFFLILSCHAVAILSSHLSKLIHFRLFRLSLSVSVPIFPVLSTSIFFSLFQFCNRHHISFCLFHTLWTLFTHPTSCSSVILSRLVSPQICVNQTCVSIDLFIEPGDCPTTNIALVCSGHGVCSSINTCYCDYGWTGYDCSQQSPDATTENPLAPPPSVPGGTGRPKRPQATASPAEKATPNQTRNVTEYGDRKKSLSAAYLVMILVSIVGGVFIFFALLATCYR